MDSLPEEFQLDKNAAWEKLSERRGEHPSRKRKWMLWPAAAMVLVLAGATVFFFKERQNHSNTPALITNKYPGTNHLPAERPSSETSLVPREIRQDPAAGTALGYRKGKTPVGNTRKTNTTNRSVKPATPSREPLNISAPEVIAIQTISLPESGLATINPAPKKKLKIVHINELEPATGIQPDVLTKKEKKRFFFYMTTGSAASVETMAGGTDPQIKIKINNNN